MRVFYSNKTGEIIKKIELSNWRYKIEEDLDQSKQRLSDSWLDEVR
tara:strand:+ start:576 stop:713 length:138 start_codon:yes stop_codon:yes gene_type:complete